MCVVDMHRWVRNRRYNDACLESSNTDAMEDYESGRQEMMIRQFTVSDKLCASLDSITRDLPPQQTPRNPIVPHANKLVRIMKDGCTTRPPTEKQLREGRQVGAATNANCFICRKYLMLVQMSQGSTRKPRSAVYPAECRSAKTIGPMSRQDVLCLVWMSIWSQSTKSLGALECIILQLYFQKLNK